MQSKYRSPYRRAPAFLFLIMLTFVGCTENSRLNALEKKLSLEKQRINTIEGQLGTHAIDELEKKVSSTEQRINAIEGQLGTIPINALGKKVSLVEQRINVIEGQLETLPINALEKEVSSTKQVISKMAEQLVNIQMERLFESVDKVAILKPGTKGFSAIKFDLGVLTVSMDNIEPYANGSKVTINFGNTLGATINGLKMKIEYGSVDERGFPLDEQAKSKEEKFTEELLPGRWTRVNSVLEGIPPDKLGFVRIKDVTHEGIVLLTGQ